MIDTQKIKEHMPVFASEGEQIGKVDHMQDGKIKLTRSDSPDHKHHLVPLSWVDRIDDAVRLNVSLSEIRTMTSGGVAGGVGQDAVPEAKVHDAVPKVDLH